MSLLNLLLLFLLTANSAAFFTQRPFECSFVMKRICQSCFEGFVPELLPASVSWSGAVSDVKNLIQYNDKHLLILYKPPQILSQAEKETKEADKPSEGDLVELVRSYRQEQEGSSFVGLVHRLDRPTSGLIVFAKHKESLRKLNEMFAQKLVKKSYLAVVNGRLEGEGKFVDFLRKSERAKSMIFNPERMSSSKGREILQSVLTRLREVSVSSPGASTPSKDVTASFSDEINGVDRALVLGLMKYKSIFSVDVNLYKEKHGSPPTEKFQSILDISLETGRKHQIRAQLAAHDFPVVGDRKYGASQRFQTKDICLHAYRLSFPHPMFLKNEIDITIAPPTIWNSRFPSPFTEKIEQLLARK